MLWLIVIIWSIPTLGLFINSFRNRDAQRATGWWKVRPDELTIDNYDTIFGARPGLGRSLLNSVSDRHPGDDHPHRDRGVRRLRLRLDRLQAPQGSVHRHGGAAGVPLQVALIPLLQMFVGGAH